MSYSYQIFTDSLTRQIRFGGKTQSANFLISNFIATHALYLFTFHLLWITRRRGWDPEIKRCVLSLCTERSSLSVAHIFFILDLYSSIRIMRRGQTTEEHCSEVQFCHSFACLFESCVCGSMEGIFLASWNPCEIIFLIRRDRWGRTPFVGRWWRLSSPVVSRRMTWQRSNSDG